MSGTRSKTGILPARRIGELIAGGAIDATGGIAGDQIQPASLDLRLGGRAFRVRASFLPGPGATVAERLKAHALHEFDLERGAVLETGCVYIVELAEHLALPDDVAGLANPKSSTGRLDIFTRVITDRARRFDQVCKGYAGPLYLEISPRSFPILMRAGSRLSQIRFRHGEPAHSDEELRALHAAVGIVGEGEPNIADGLALSVDLVGAAGGKLVGYRAKRHSAVIDVDRRGTCEIAEFWEPLAVRRGATLILDPNEFYILASKEAVRVPPSHAAEMVPIDPLMGEFRVHYAGFFDPGFGHGAPSRAVLEVRSHEVPFMLEDGQFVGRLVYEKLTEAPERLYGEDIGSNYQGQGLKLSKHFRAD